MFIVLNIATHRMGFKTNNGKEFLKVIGPVNAPLKSVKGATKPSEFLKILPKKKLNQ